MNICRLTLITLSFALIAACGGGGGSGTAVTPATTPVTPRDGDEPVNPFADLVNFMPTANSSSIQAVEGIVSATNASIKISDVFEEGSENRVATSCNVNGCIALLPGSVVTVPFLHNIVTDVSLISNHGSYFLTYSSEITRGIPIEGVTFAGGNLTGTRYGDNSTVEFKTFAGWLDGSIFGIIQASVEESGNQQHRFISYNAGVPSGSDPSGTGSARWEGAAVATVKADRTFIQGDATITIADFTNPLVVVELENLRDANNPEIPHTRSFTFRDLHLDGNGVFKQRKPQSEVEGRFFGTNHEEVGGWFDSDDVTGAFGGTKQTTP